MTHRYLVLGLLATQAMTGYDIRKRVEAKLSLATNISYGTLYPILHRLDDDGAVESEDVEQESRPTKTVYYITEQGQDELVNWLQAPLGKGRSRREFLLKLYFAEQHSIAAAKRLIAQRLKQVQRALQQLPRAEQITTDRGHRWLISYARTQHAMEIAWLEQLQDEMSHI